MAVRLGEQAAEATQTRQILRAVGNAGAQALQPVLGGAQGHAEHPTEIPGGEGAVPLAGQLLHQDAGRQELGREMVGLPLGDAVVRRVLQVDVAELVGQGEIAPPEVAGILIVEHNVQGGPVPGFAQGEAVPGVAVATQAVHGVPRDRAVVLHGIDDDRLAVVQPGYVKAQAVQALGQQQPCRRQ